MDSLLPEILHLIAGTNMETYYSLVRAYPRFARLITNGVRFDYAEKFGIDCRITKYETIWTLNGNYHRADGPAIANITGRMDYYKNGIRHRIGGPAIICDNGSLYYCINGKFHRDDGPAIINSMGEEYYKHGKLHRIDGPSVTRQDGSYIAYHIDGDAVTPEHIEYRLQHGDYFFERGRKSDNVFFCIIFVK